MPRKSKADLAKEEAKKPKAKIGRPSIFTQELADKICNTIATNSGGLKKLCAQFDFMPDEQTINEWRWKNRNFGGQYLEAKQTQMHLMLEECEELAENVLYYYDKDGNKRIDAPSVAKQMAKINMRKWHASKLAPKFYGDKHTVEDLLNSNNDMRDELMQLREQLAEKNKKDY